MKKIQANRRDEAFKELKAIDESLIAKVEETINESDKKLFHVVLVRIIDRPGQAKNDVSLMVQKYHQRGFEKIQKSFAFQGFNKIILLHDPSLLKEEELKATPTPVVDPVPTKEEIEKEIERRAEEKAKEIIAKAQQSENVEGKEIKEEEKGNDGVPVYGKTIAEMKSFAESNEIDLTGLRKSEDIEKAILSWIEDQKA